MESPKTTTATRIVVPVSSVPVVVKSPNSQRICPSINLQLSMPRVAGKDKALRMTALIGRIMEPVKMKMRRKTRKV